MYNDERRLVTVELSPGSLFAAPDLPRAQDFRPVEFFYGY